MSDLDLAQGASFAGYTILRRLGAGRTSVRYEAHDRSGKTVMLQIWPQGLASPKGQPESRARLLELTRLRRRGDHSLAWVVSLGAFARRPYLATLAVAGQTLREALDAAGLLEAGLAALIVAQAAEAMARAHRLEVAHRDLCPEHIMLVEGGGIAVIGFDTGLRADPGGLAGMAALAPPLPATAPEQFAALCALGPAADVHALGAVLYELLTGLRLAPGEAPRRLGDAIPAAVAQVVLRALGRAPEGRYAEAGTLATALRSAAGLPPAPGEETAGKTPTRGPGDQDWFTAQRRLLERIQEQRRREQEAARQPVPSQPEGGEWVSLEDLAQGTSARDDGGTEGTPKGAGGLFADLFERAGELMRSTGDLVRAYTAGEAEGERPEPADIIEEVLGAGSEESPRAPARPTGSEESPGAPARPAAETLEPPPTQSSDEGPGAPARPAAETPEPPPTRPAPDVPAPSAGGGTEPPEVETRARRLDAAMPRVVGLRRTVRLLVQIRLPESRPLGPEDWPEATRPDAVERDTPMIGLTYRREGGVLRNLPLRIEVRSASFAISVEPPEPDGEVAPSDRPAIWDLELTPDGESPRMPFWLTARRIGPAEVDVLVRTLPDGRLVGAAYVGASVDEGAPVDPTMSQATARIFPQVVSPFAGLQIWVEQQGDGCIATMRLDQADGNTPSDLADEVPVAFDRAALLEAANDPEAYGRLLAGQLFADPHIRDGWARARQHAEECKAALRVSLRIEGEDWLHTIFWEVLRDPIDGLPVALAERVLLSRYIPSPDVTRVTLPQKDELRAVLVVASPVDSAERKLGPIDVAGEVRQARQALGAIPAELLSRDAGGAGPPTLGRIRRAIASGAHVLYLIGHGTQPEDDEPVIWLEDDTGAAAPVRASKLVEMIQLTGRRPLLVVLASCYSAGGGRADSMVAIGPRLAAAGVPAVVGFQGQVAAGTARRLLEPLFEELGAADGVIDRALAVARASVTDDAWWQAVLWLRTRDGRLWTAGKEPML